MDTAVATHVDMAAIGLAIGRIVLGLLMAAHGSQKLFGWFGGYGLHRTGEFFVQLGFRNGPLFAGAAGLGEVASGVLVVLGLLGPIGPALMVSVMLVAALAVHWGHGLFASTNGVEVPLLYGAGALALALTGFGPWSLDAVLGLSSAWTPTVTWTALVVGVLGALANLMIRRRGPVVQQA
jgi:putative oxidoreductase